MAGFDDAIDVINSVPQSQPQSASVAAPPSGFSSAIDTIDQARSASPQVSDTGRLLITRPSKKESQSSQDIGTTEALGRGIAQGVTANFYDELRGLHEAGGAGPDEPMSLNSVLRGAFRKMTGDQQAEKTYQDTTARERQTNQQAEEQHPAATLAGNIGGALVLPVGGAAGGATLAARMGRGAAVGAGYGATYGAGEGDNLSDRASRAVSGAALGGLLGGAAPVVLAGASRVGDAVGSVLGHPIQTIKGMFNPDQEALKRAGGALREDAATGAGLSPADISAAHNEGQPIAVIDLGGENLRDLGRSAANVSSSARAALNNTLDQRYGSQAERVSEFIRSLSPFGGHATVTGDALSRAADAANKPAYQRIMAANPHIDVPSEITDRPVVAQAMKDAYQLAKNYGQDLRGKTSVKTILSGPGYHIADDVAAPPKTSLQYWDYVKKAIDARIEGLKRRGGIDELNSKEKADYRGLIDSKNALVDHLDAVVPAYREARAGAASFFGAENALEAGQKFINMRGSLDEAHAALSKMTPAQRSLFAEGFASDLADKISKVADNRSVTIDRVFNSSDGRARINMALGPQNASKLETFLRVENIMQEARKAITGNSTTARQLLQSRLAGGLGQTAIASGIGSAAGAAQAMFSGNVDTKTLITAGLVGAGVGARGYVNANVAKKVGELLASGKTSDMLKVVNMAKGNPNLGKAIRRAETFIERASGSRSGTLAPSFGGGAIPAAASDQQQSQPQAGSQ